MDANAAAAAVAVQARMRAAQQAQQVQATGGAAPASLASATLLGAAGAGVSYGGVPQHLVPGLGEAYAAPQAAQQAHAVAAPGYQQHVAMSADALALDAAALDASGLVGAGVGGLAYGNALAQQHYNLGDAFALPATVPQAGRRQAPQQQPARPAGPPPAAMQQPAPPAPAATADWQQQQRKAPQAKTKAQKAALEAILASGEVFPSKSRCVELGVQIGLSTTQVQNWFQYKRRQAVKNGTAGKGDGLQVAHVKGLQLTISRKRPAPPEISAEERAAEKARKKAEKQAELEVAKVQVQLPDDDALERAVAVLRAAEAAGVPPLAAQEADAAGAENKPMSAELTALSRQLGSEPLARLLWGPEGDEGDFPLLDDLEARLDAAEGEGAALKAVDVAREVAWPPAGCAAREPLSERLSRTQAAEVLSAWAFLSSMGPALGLWPFSCIELVDALESGRGRLLTDLHIVMLRLVLSDVAQAIDFARGELVLQNTLSTAQAAVLAAPEHRMDPRAWMAHLNELTWPEVLRQLAVCSGWDVDAETDFYDADDSDGTWVDALAAGEYGDLSLGARVSALLALLSSAMCSGPVREALERREATANMGRRLQYVERNACSKRDRGDALAGRKAAGESAAAKAAHDALIATRRRQRAARDEALVALVRDTQARGNALGCDRRRNAYFVLASPDAQGSSVYVCTHASPQALEDKEEGQPCESRMLEIATEAGLDELLAALDARGASEAQLKENLLRECTTLRPAMRAAAYARACGGAARAPAHLCETMGDEEVASLHAGRMRTRAAGHAHCAPLSGAAAELRLETVREAVVDMKRGMPANAREEGWDAEAWLEALRRAASGGELLDALYALERGIGPVWISSRLPPAVGAPWVEFPEPGMGGAASEGTEGHAEGAEDAEGEQPRGGEAEAAAGGGGEAADDGTEGADDAPIEHPSSWPAATSAAAALRLFELDHALSFSAGELSALDADPRFGAMQPGVVLAEGGPRLLPPPLPPAARAAEEARAAREVEEERARAERRARKRGASARERRVIQERARPGSRRAHVIATGQLGCGKCRFAVGGCSTCQGWLRDARRREKKRKRPRASAAAMGGP